VRIRYPGATVMRLAAGFVDGPQTLYRNSASPLLALPGLLGLRARRQGCGARCVSEPTRAYWASDGPRKTSRMAVLALPNQGEHRQKSHRRSVNRSDCEMAFLADDANAAAGVLENDNFRRLAAAAIAEGGPPEQCLATPGGGLRYPRPRSGPGNSKLDCGGRRWRRAIKKLAEKCPV